MNERTERGGLALGVIAGCVWALPIAWRLEAPPLLARYALVAAGCVWIAGPLVFALRARSARSGSAASAIAWTAALCAGPLALLGSVLKAQTHHRQLGGAAFALLSAGLVLVLAPVVARAIQRAARGGHARAVRGVVAAVSAASLAFCVLRLARAPDPFARGLLLEVSVGLVCLAVAGRVRYVPPPWMARAGAWSWIAIAIAGVIAARTEPDASKALAAGAPLTFGLTISPQK
jgi:hypothetical protein